MAWLPNFDNGIKFSIDHTKIDDDLTHFPVTLSLSSTFCSEVFLELESDSNRFKIAFTKDDGITELYGEIERFDCVNSKAVYYISKNDWTIVSGTNTDFYMYYDSNHADNTNYIGDIGSTSGAAVWDSNFKMVQHMCQDPSGASPQMIDSTSNSNDGTSVGSMTSADLVDSKVGKALDFDGVNDGIIIPDFIYDIPFTVSGIFKNTDLAGVLYQYFYSHGTVGTLNSLNIYLAEDSNSSAPVLRLNWGDNNEVKAHVDVSVDYGNSINHTFDLVITSTGTSLYIDGVLKTANTISNGTFNPNTDIYIAGREDLNADRFFHGVQDEVKISSSARSAAWIKATYDSLFDNLVIKIEDMNWLTNFDNRIKFSIDHTKIDEDLTHFPVTLLLSLIKGSEVFSELGSDANRFKIAFTKDDGVTELYGEIEQFDYANLKAVYHISKSDWTIVSGTNTDFYMYYDSNHADNTNYIGDIGSISGESVWDSNFKMVQHMVDATTSTILDSTNNNNNGTKKAVNEPVEVEGEIGKGQDFDGGNDFVSVNDDTSLKSSVFTIEALIYPRAYGTDGWGKAIWHRNDGSYQGVSLILSDKAGYENKGKIEIGTGSSWEYSYSTTDISLNQWTYIVGLYEGMNLKCFFNGNEEDSVPSNNPSYGIINPRIGATSTYNINRFFDGHIDEVRISNIARSTAWIKATYDSLFDNLVTKVEEGQSSINAIFFGFNF